MCAPALAARIAVDKMENLIRPAKLGLRHYLFFGSLEAGANNAQFYSLLANCRGHGLEPDLAK